MKVLRRLFAAGFALVVVAGIWAIGSHLHDSGQRRAFARQLAENAPLRVVDHGELPGEVRESSGLAASRKFRGVFWTHNDSGDGPRLYALDSGARLLATVTLDGVEARDWEDIDIGPCPRGAAEAGACLYVADTGDNGRRRASVVVHAVPEPDPLMAPETVAPVATVRITYEGGPFDAEALAVTPSGEVVLATKGRAPTAWVFTVSAEDFARAGEAGGTLHLTSRVALPFEPRFTLGRQVTGGTFGAGGRLLALRTYTEVYFYEWPLASPPVEAAPSCGLGFLEPVGEAIAFTAEERLYLASESAGSRRGHLLEIECAGVGG